MTGRQVDPGLATFEGPAPRAGTSARPQSRARRPAVEPADCRAASERRSDGLTAWARQAEFVVAKQLKYGAVQPMPEHSDGRSPHPPYSLRDEVPTGSGLDVQS